MNEAARQPAVVEPDDRREGSEEEPRGQFARHFLEMAVAMMIGMPLWHMFFALVIAPAGFADEVSASPELWYGLMTFFMAVPMFVFMLYRGHSWGRGVEMVAAMAAPVALVLLLSRVGAGSYLLFLAGRGLSMSTHVAMYLGMFLIMVARRSEYSSAHSQASGSPGAR